MLPPSIVSNENYRKHNQTMATLNLRADLTQALRAARPNLAKSSLTSYVGRLYNIPKNMRLHAPNIKWFSRNVRQILKFLGGMPPSARENVLTPLYLLTEHEEVHEQMLLAARQTDEDAKQRTKSATQEDNWIAWADVQLKFADLHNRAEKLWNKRTLAERELIILSDCVLLGMYVHFPPRRSQDYGLMKVVSGEIGGYDNELSDDAETMTFRTCKTSKVYGIQSFSTPTQLRMLLQEWLEINPSEWLILNSKRGPTSSSSLTKILNRIFGRNVSSSMLRHAFLSEIYGVGRPNIGYTEKEDLSQKMAHNVATAELYAKK